MKSAFLVGALGTALSFWLGSRYLEWTSVQVLWALWISNVAGFVGLLSTLALERRPSLRRAFMHRSFQVWGVFALLYFGILLGVIPALRDWKALGLMTLPLIFANGWMIPLFGVTQDAIIRRGQRRAG